ncbi:hypothetical protein [Paraconexibacter sp.]|uniref:hypothetical protein n=1 Tax=Paraconexibacter sp. TaxID=2949640 RepID=UPI00356216DB
MVAPDPADYERRFRRAGLPLFIAGRDADTDVWNHAFPLLALVFLAETSNGLNFAWSVAANIAAVVASLAIVLGGVALLNRLRGRAALAVPESIGRLELAAFVLLPAALPLIFGGQVTSALVTIGGNLLLLALVYGVLAYGLLSIVRWAARRLAGQLGRSVLLLARAIPLLLLFSVVLFINTEMWQVFALMDDATLGAIVVLLVLVGTAFLVGRIPREVAVIEHEAGGDGPPLDRHQVINVGLVLFVSQALQVLVVSLAIAGFFTVFGLLAISDEVLDAWIGTAQGTRVLGIGDFSVLGVRVHLTQELLRVAVAIAAFSGLYYSIAVLTDSTYREEFLEEITAEMRATFADRAAYLRLRS